MSGSERAGAPQHQPSGKTDAHGGFKGHLPTESVSPTRVHRAGAKSQWAGWGHPSRQALRCPRVQVKLRTLCPQQVRGPNDDTLVQAGSHRASAAGLWVCKGVFVGPSHRNPMEGAGSVRLPAGAAGPTVPEITPGSKRIPTWSGPGASLLSSELPALPSRRAFRVRLTQETRGSHLSKTQRPAHPGPDDPGSQPHPECLSPQAGESPALVGGRPGQWTAPCGTLSPHPVGPACVQPLHRPPGSRALLEVGEEETAY